MRHIPSSEIKQPGFHADTLGYTFVWQGHFLRGIYPKSVDLAKSYFECGFINEIVSKGLFPRTWISEYENDQFGMIIEHEMISPVLYATEWNFMMLKAAALMVLDIAQIGWKYGFNMVDCHKLNVMFKGSKPVYVDLGSFVPREEGCTGWLPYMNFMTSYYYILDMWKDGASQIAKRMMAPGVTIQAKDYYIYKSKLCRFFPRLVTLKIQLNTYLAYLASQPDEKIVRKTGGTPGSLKAKIICSLHRIVQKLSLSPSQHLKRIQHKVLSISMPIANSVDKKEVNILDVKKTLKALDVKSVSFIDSPIKEIVELSENLDKAISIQQKEVVSDAEYRYLSSIGTAHITQACFFLGNGAILVRGKFPEDRLSSDVAVVMGYQIPAGNFGLHNAMVFFNQCKRFSKTGHLIVNIPRCKDEIKDELMNLYFTDVVGDTFLI
jgi:hypothetical protein